jgi:hypothetical protein
LTVNWNEWGAFAPLPEPTKAGLTAIVVGSARGWLCEAYDAKKAFPGAETFAVNRAGIALAEDTDFWVTVHPEIFFPERNWQRVVTISDKPDGNTDQMGNPCVDQVFPIATMGGSSALLAVCVALAMGFERVVLAGVHLETPDYQCMRDRWQHYAPVLRGRVASLAPEGYWMRELLGGVDQWPQA